MNSQNLSRTIPILPLVCVSILSSIFVVVLTALVFSISNLLWLVPIAFIYTVALYGIFFILSNSESNAIGSLRVYSAALTGALFFAAALWLAVATVIVICIVQVAKGQLPPAPRGRLWAMITAAVVSSLNLGLVTAIAMQVYKTRQSLRYMEKWRWRPGVSTSHWSINTAV